MADASAPKIISSPRIEWLDFAKGVAIILVVLAHALKYSSDAVKFIALFHMPFFFVTAGFLLNTTKWGGIANTKLSRRNSSSDCFCRIVSQNFCCIQFAWRRKFSADI